MIKDFETTPDVDHLPDVDELKCYFLCLNIEVHLMKPNSTKIDPSEVIELAQKLNNEEYKGMLKLARGCLSRVRTLKEPTEVAYQLNVCSKRNSPEVNNFFFYFLLLNKCYVIIWDCISYFQLYYTFY